MSKLWTAADGTDPANLNATFGWDAIVSKAVTGSSGAWYDDLMSAVNAGHRNILVEPGDYTGDGIHTFTSSHDGLRVTGAVPLVSDGSTLTDGARFANLVFSTISDVQFNSIGSLSSTNHGFDVQASVSHAVFEDCISWGAAGQGWLVQGIEYITLARCKAGQANAAGFYVRAPAAALDQFGVTLDTCWAFENEGHGFAVMDYTAADTSTARSIALSKCIARNNAQGYAASGFFVENATSALIQGCLAIANGVTGPEIVGNGFYIRIPELDTYQGSSLMGNHAISNRGGGFQLDASSTRVLLMGNRSASNAYGNYVNCANCPGFGLNLNTNG